MVVKSERDRNFEDQQNTFITSSAVHATESKPIQAKKTVAEPASIPFKPNGKYLKGKKETVRSHIWHPIRRLKIQIWTVCNKIPARKTVTHPASLIAQICTSYNDKDHHACVRRCNDGLCKSTLFKIKLDKPRALNVLKLQEKNCNSERTTSLIPTQRRHVTIRTRIAAHGSTTISSQWMYARAKKVGKLSWPPKNRAWKFKKTKNCYQQKLN